VEQLTVVLPLDPSFIISSLKLKKLFTLRQRSDANRSRGRLRPRTYFSKQFKKMIDNIIKQHHHGANNFKTAIPTN
jgi:hypothetical protein